MVSEFWILYRQDFHYYLLASPAVTVRRILIIIYFILIYTECEHIHTRRMQLINNHVIFDCYTFHRDFNLHCLYSMENNFNYLIQNLLIFCVNKQFFYLWVFVAYVDMKFRIRAVPALLMRKYLCWGVLGLHVPLCHPSFLSLDYLVRGYCGAFRHRASRKC